jgi:hypothetical protein
MATTSIQYPTVLDGILTRPGMPSPLLLDAIKYAETGHLSPDKANRATSGAGAIGQYQLLQNNLHDMGYGVRPNITIPEARDPVKARQIAYDYISGYKKHHGFDTIQDTLVAYNWGPTNAAKWKAAGSKWEDLPLETQQYVRRASQYIYNNPEQFNNAGSMMANFSQMQPQQQTQGSSSMVQPNPQPNPMNALMQSINNTQTGVNTMFGNNTQNPGLGQLRGYFSQMSQPAQPVQQLDPTDPALLAAMQYEKAAGNVQLDPSINPYAPPNQNVLYAYDYKNTGRDYESLNDPDSFIRTDPNPLLNDDPGDRFETAPSQYDQEGALATKIENVPTTQGGALTTGNRYRTPLSLSAPKAMDINEMLIRMGSAGLAQAANGGTAMMAAAGTEYGNLMDQQRTNALAAYQASLSAKPDGKDDKDNAEVREQIAGMDQTLYDMQMAKGLLEQGGLTGFFQGTLGSTWDSIMGNPEAGSRLLLKKLRVDDALLRVAQTKGAISNNEMKLFLSPAPSTLQDEQVWIDWINQRMQAIQNVRNRLAQGISLDPSQVATTGQINQFGSSIGTPVTLSNGATVTKLD